jgi:hypothetical protein
MSSKRVSHMQKEEIKAKIQKETRRNNSRGNIEAIALSISSRVLRIFVSRLKVDRKRYGSYKMGMG